MDSAGVLKYGRDDSTCLNGNFVFRNSFATQSLHINLCNRLILICSVQH